MRSAPLSHGSARIAVPPTAVAHFRSRSGSDADIDYSAADSIQRQRTQRPHSIAESPLDAELGMCLKRVFDSTEYLTENAAAHFERLSRLRRAARQIATLPPPTIETWEYRRRGPQRAYLNATTNAPRICTRPPTVSAVLVPNHEMCSGASNMVCRWHSSHNDGSHPDHH